MARELIDEHGQPAFPSFYQHGPEPVRRPEREPPSEFPLGTILLVGATLVGLYFAGTYAYSLIPDRQTLVSMDFPDYVAGLLYYSADADWKSVHPYLYPAEPGALRPSGDAPLLAWISSDGNPVSDLEIRYATDGGPFETARTGEDGSAILVVPRSLGNHRLKMEVPAGKWRESAASDVTYRVIQPPPDVTSVAKDGFEGNRRVLKWEVEDDPSAGPVKVFGVFTPAFWVARWEFLTVVDGSQRSAAVEGKIPGTYMICSYNEVGFAGCATTE